MNEADTYKALKDFDKKPIEEVNDAIAKSIFLDDEVVGMILIKEEVEYDN